MGFEITTDWLEVKCSTHCANISPNICISHPSKHIYQWLQIKNNTNDWFSAVEQPYTLNTTVTVAALLLLNTTIHSITFVYNKQHFAAVAS